MKKTAFLLVSVLLLGCDPASGVKEELTCNPGATQPCLCGNGEIGIQRCRVDGLWGGCQCFATDVNLPGDGAELLDDGEDSVETEATDDTIVSEVNEDRDETCLPDDRTCDGVDDDCDGGVDEDCPTGQYMVSVRYVSGGGFAAGEDNAIFGALGNPVITGTTSDGNYTIRSRIIVR